jgi:hypothetical protein
MITTSRTVTLANRRTVSVHLGIHDISQGSHAPTVKTWRQRGTGGPARPSGRARLPGKIKAQPSFAQQPAGAVGVVPEATGGGGQGATSLTVAGAVLAAVICAPV